MAGESNGLSGHQRGPDDSFEGRCGDEIGYLRDLSKEFTHNQ